MERAKEWSAELKVPVVLVLNKVSRDRRGEVILEVVRGVVGLGGHKSGE